MITAMFGRIRQIVMNGSDEEFLTLLAYGTLAVLAFVLLVASVGMMVTA